MLKVGIDIGYNATKVSDGNRTDSFPSVTGTPDLSRFKVIGSTPTVIVYDKEEFIYGDDAIYQSEILTRNEDRKWIETVLYSNLFVSALSKIVMKSEEKVKLVTGLPVAFYDDKDKLAKILSGEWKYTKILDGVSSNYKVEVEDIRVIPQPFGTALSIALDKDGNISDSELAKSNIGIIDIGGKTTNILSIRKLQEQTKKTTSVNFGGWDLVRRVGKRLTSMYSELETNDSEVESYIRVRSMRYFGKTIDITNIINEEAQPIIRAIHNDCVSLWGSASSMDKIYITGGGSYLMFQYLKNTFQHAEHAENSVFANCIGYQKFAMRL